MPKTEMRIGFLILGLARRRVNSGVRGTYHISRLRIRAGRGTRGFSTWRTDWFAMRATVVLWQTSAMTGSTDLRRSPLKSDKLTGIEAGRGVAAMLVVGVHARDPLFKNFGVPVPLGDLFFFGHAGVDFFFVLSGFIIMHVHASDIGRPGRLGHYLQRRFTRIYPFYWIVLLLTVLALALSSRPDAFPSIPYITSSALLLPGGGAPVVPVAWTLKNEVVFYAVFSVLILHRNLGLVLLGVWLAIILSRFSDLLVGGN